FHFDQSDHERLSHAKVLNVPDVYARYENELMPEQLKALFNLYQRLGTPDWSGRAYLHYQGKQEVLARTVFQRSTLMLLADKDGSALLDEAEGSRQQTHPKQQQLGHAVTRMLAAGVSVKDIALVVREMQYHALFICATCLTTHRQTCRS